MAGRIFHPETKHPEPYQKDLGPDASKGLNDEMSGPPIATRTAHEVKEAHNLLTNEFSDEELRQIPVMCEGARLETGATYLNLAADDRQEIRAKGEDVKRDDLFVAKKDVPYELWNRLSGVGDARRTAEPG